MAQSSKSLTTSVKKSSIPTCKRRSQLPPFLSPVSNHPSVSLHHLSPPFMGVGGGCGSYRIFALSPSLSHQPSPRLRLTSLGRGGFYSVPEPPPGEGTSIVEIDGSYDALHFVHRHPTPPSGPPNVYTNLANLFHAKCSTSAMGTIASRARHNMYSLISPFYFLILTVSHACGVLSWNKYHLCSTPFHLNQIPTRPPEPSRLSATSRKRERVGCGRCHERRRHFVAAPSPALRTPSPGGHGLVAKQH